MDILQGVAGRRVLFGLFKIDIGPVSDSDSSGTDMASAAAEGRGWTGTTSTTSASWNYVDSMDSGHVLHVRLHNSNIRLQGSAGALSWLLMLVAGCCCGLTFVLGLWRSLDSWRGKNEKMGPVEIAGWSGHTDTGYPQGRYDIRWPGTEAT